MKDVIINHLMSNIIKYKNFDENKLKEIKYGIESFYLTVSKLIVIFALAYIMGLFKSLCIFVFFYSLLRLNGFGLHAKKSWQCWVASVIVFLLIPYLCANLHFNKLFLLLISGLSLILIILFSPADTEKRPIISFKKRLIHKILCSITVLIYIFSLMFLQNDFLCNIIFFSIILETLMILPISYKIFGLKYNNYKKYL